MLAAAGELLGPDRPRQFGFDSMTRYEDVRSAFETISEALGVVTDRRTGP